MDLLTELKQLLATYESIHASYDPKDNSPRANVWQMVIGDLEQLITDAEDKNQ